MSESIQTAVKAIQERFAAKLEEFRGEFSVFVDPEQIIPVLTQLRDEFGYNMLMDITAVDYYPQETPRFHVVYQLYSMPHNVRVQVRVPLNGNAPALASVEKVFAVANWKEREVYDLFGITFNNHSDPRRIVMPQDWVGHPLRKDYPLGYEEVQFTFNFDEIMANKPHPKD
jgi:NADH-quinone oxidoreductase subunit C